METELAGHSLMAVAGYWEYENNWFLDVDGYPEAIQNTALQDEYDQTTFELRSQTRPSSISSVPGIRNLT